MSAMSLKDVRCLKKRAALSAHIEAKIPGFRIVKKDKSFFMKLLSFFLFFNRDFMTRYVTTIYPKVYVPSWWGKETKNKSLEIEILAHEYVHLYDRKRLGMLFNIIYLSPQVFSLLAIGAIWNTWFLLALSFLLPWPSPGRAWLEFRGYRVSLLMKYWILTSLSPDKEKIVWHYINNDALEWTLDQFISYNYYFMFPFRSFLRKRFINELKCVTMDDNNLSDELKRLKEIALR